MMLITWLEEAQLHRETGIAILEAFVKHGERRAFSEKVGISPQWYSYIRRPLSDSMLSLEAIGEVARCLPAPRQYQNALYNHLALARMAYEIAWDEVRRKVKTRDVEPLIEELDVSFRKALFTRDAGAAKVAYSETYSLGLLLGDTISPVVHPLEYIEVCSRLAHVCYALDEGGDGLFWAKKGQLIANNYPILELENTADRVGLNHLRFVLSRDVALGFHNLGIPSKALDSYELAQSLVDDNKRLADIHRNRLLTLSKSSRFTLSEAEGLAYMAKTTFEKEGDEISFLLTNDGLARAYLAYGGKRNRRLAVALLDSTIQEMDLCTSSGKIHQLVPRITAARAYWYDEDEERWELALQEAWGIAESSGLRYQQRKIIKEFGENLIGIIEPDSLAEWLVEEL